MNAVEASNSLMERVNTTCGCVGALVLVTLTMCVLQFRVSRSQSVQIQRLEDALEDAKNTLLLTIDICHQQQQLYHKTIAEQLTDQHAHTTEQLTELKQLWTKHQKTDHTVNTFSPIQPFRGMDEAKSTVVEHEIVAIANIHEDDELINECYDSIPLNNVKKNTSITWLFK